MKDSRQVVLINLDDILPNRFQPRIKFDEKAIIELSESIKEHGVIQPIIVRKISDKYEIIAGERRYKASVMAGKSSIPAIIVNLNDKDSSEIALIENVQRQDLTPIEEAISYRKILDMGYLTQEALATKLGVAQPTIANKLRLLNLDDEVQEALLDGKISERHARSLLRLEKTSMQRAMLKRIIDERLTVRKTDEEINNMIKNNEVNMDSIENNDITPFENNTSNVSNVSENPFIIGNQNNTQSTPVSSNVEVLDFGFDEINPDKEAQELDNVIENNNTNVNDLNNFNNINIPSAPIVEDEEPIKSEIKSIQNPNEFNEEPKVSNLSQEPINKTVEINNSVEENYQPSGRFFTMVKPSFEEETVAPVQDISVPNNEVTENNNISNVSNVFSFGTTQPEAEQPDSLNISTTEPVQQASENIFNTPVTFETPNVEPIQSVQSPVIDDVVDDVIDISPLPINYSEAIPNGQPIMQKESLSLRDVINKIRKCADEIESMGFGIDTEEFDFDDMYQVIFKIKK